MPKLSELVRAVQQDLPITVRMERWLLANADARYSVAALDFERAFGAGEVGGKRHRKPAFRASGMGKCARKRILARLGVTQEVEGFSSEQANIFHTGNALHMKWQKAGITEGWLVAAEVPLHSDELDLGGTADGFVYDGSLFEFKTVNDRGYKWVFSRKAPSEDHVRQVAAYKLLRPELTAASVVYENKNSGEWREFRVQYTDEVMEPVVAELDMLRRSLREHELPEIKDECRVQKGMEYRTCPFRDTCLTLHRKNRVWPQSVAE